MMKEGISSTLSLLFISFIGLGFFCKGFFPVKPLLPGFRESIPTTSASETPIFSRLVFILIDALRSDFVFDPDSEMNFVSTLIESGNALPFTAIASAPTVTLPRLKAITSGSNPTFLDAILNIAEDSSSVLENVDSWVRQFAYGSNQSLDLPRKKIAFVGDDTWLRLFPKSWFSWSEGVTSFFVSDTQTVDFNVTRHLPTLLSEPKNEEEISFKSDAPTSWDVLILHYLGLDHVGHLGGPNSLLMAPKQREMDDVIKRVYGYLKDQDQKDGERSLLVVIGDHGMTDMGNHGGATEGEVSAALLFISPSIQTKPISYFKDPERRFSFYERVNQIDLVPTLSALFGLGVPSNSMGKVITSILDNYGDNEFTTSVLSDNIQQISSILEIADPGSIKELGKAVIKDEMIEFLYQAQERLLSTFGDYHMYPMIIGLIILSLAASGLFLKTRSILSIGENSKVVGTISIAFVLYLGSFFATSFIEEEHEYWFFITGTFVLLLALKNDIDLGDRLRLLALSATIRIMRGWTRNGQKDIPNINISSYLSKSPQLLFYICFTIFALRIIVSVKTLIEASQSTRGKNIPIQQLFFRALSFAILAVLCIVQITVLAATYLMMDSSQSFIWFLRLLESLGIERPVELARISYGVALALLILAKAVEYAFKDINLDVLKLSTSMILLISLTPHSKIPLFFLLWSQYKSITPSLKLSPLLFTTLILCLQHVSFFAFGGSNSLATIDLSQAYNGISSYDVRFVSLLTFLSNFSGPIFWSLATPTLIRSNIPISSQSNISFTKHYTIVSAFHSLSLAFLALSATHFRRHLFTFTVFSPALLYKGVWSVLICLGSDLIFASLL